MFNGLVDINHTGIIFKSSETLYFSIDFGTLNGQKDKSINFKFGGRSVQSSFSLHVYDFNDPRLDRRNFLFPSSFATLKITQQNCEYFRKLLNEILNLENAPSFMQKYHALALVKRTDDDKAANCRFGSIYVILWILFELKENQLRVLNPMTSEYETENFKICIENAIENLKELKSTLYKENKLSSFKERTFDESFLEILDKLNKQNPNEWMLGHLKNLLNTKLKI